ncbi:hypothetical protein GGR50DRAFT_660097 [Xylaria sp. CBS 124048]|nr:hypothetical protein GGR50DRAFT_660097 [Xylaria sp. CBS 124048]
MSKQQRAVEFEKIINEGRERKRNEKLAALIFSSGKDGQSKSSASSAKPGHGGSLASRVGVRKNKTGNANGDWTHDVHRSQKGAARRTKLQQQQPAPNSLAARVHQPGTTLPKARPTAPRARSDRKAKLAHAVFRTAATPAHQPQHQQQQQMKVEPQPEMAGFSIKGLAGPFAVLAQNFAPGTTAADIESALTPVGGIIISCRLVKVQPIVIAEIVFDSKEGAERVIDKFDKQNADGRLLSVFMKPGGYTPPPKPARTNETRLKDNSVLIDGSMGFGDPMDEDEADQGLYSDRLVSANRTNGSGGGPLYRTDRGAWQGW